MEEINKFFALTSKRDKETDKIVHDLVFSNVSVERYPTSYYALWLDLRSTDDSSLHGTGRTIQNASEGITNQISKTKKYC